MASIPTLLEKLKDLRNINMDKNEDEGLSEGRNFETNYDLSSEDEKEEIEENFQNVEHENENEQPDILEIENSENSDDCDFTEERPPPEPPPDQPSTSGLPRTQKNIIECPAN